MGYTPVELRHVSVRRRLFGYDRRSVQQILDEVAESFETVWRDRGELADKVEALVLEADELRQREQALLNTLVAAERVAEDVRQQARRESDVIVAEARVEAREIVRTAEHERARLRSEVRRIEALLRSALRIVGETGEIATPGARDAAVAEPVAQAVDGEPDTTDGSTVGTAAPAPASTQADAADRAAEAPVEAGAKDDAGVEDTPGWPPLREVAQGSTRFDWGS
jgi:cell division initiation protein